MIGTRRSKGVAKLAKRIREDSRAANLQEAEKLKNVMLEWGVDRPVWYQGIGVGFEEWLRSPASTPKLSLADKFELDRVREHGSSASYIRLWRAKADQQRRFRLSVTKANELFQKSSDHGRAAFVAVLHALTEAAPEMSREFQEIMANGLVALSDPRSDVYKAWATADRNTLSPQSVLKLQFKGEVAAFVHVLWLSLGSQKAAVTLTWKICRDKAKKLGVKNWGKRTPGTYYEDMRCVLPLLNNQRDGRPALETPNALTISDNNRPKATAITSCLSILSFCRSVSLRGEDLTDYVKELAAGRLGSRVLPSRSSG